MKKVVFVSNDKSVILVKDTESEVMYGNVSKKDIIRIALKEHDYAIAMLLAHNPHYQVAKRIHVRHKITVEVSVEVARIEAVKTAEDALRIASKFGLGAEVQRELNNGATPLEALSEWDIL